ncbi:MAG: MerR family transcriptional regulator [Acidimicrobiia bacterium]
MAERAHLSIGEVLGLLQEEFPDVTISKIRFLESQGLLDPERTPSGYRKFYGPDIERLRWILRQQKDNFLPLRVIKERLRNGDDPLGADEATADGTRPAAAPAAEPLAAPEPSRERAPVVATRPGPTPGPAPAPPPAPRTPQAPAQAEAMPSRVPATVDDNPAGATLNRAALAAASGLPDRVIDELTRFGLLTGRNLGRDTIYEEDAVVVARIAASFQRYGVEARHLRMYKVAAEREAGFFEQVVTPLVKQRNPDARRQAAANLDELVALGEALRAVMLRQALRPHER